MVKCDVVKSILLVIVLCMPAIFLPACDTEDVPSEEESKTVPNDEKDEVKNSNFSHTVTITFGNTVTVSNPMEGNGVEVQVNDNQVAIVSTEEEIEYVVSGSTTDGMLKVYSDYKFKLTLDGVSITNPSGPAINIQSHKRVFVQLNDGTLNTLTDGSSYSTDTGEDQKAAFFSEGQLIFKGSGSLTVNGNNKHALCSDDYVRIYEGTFNLTSKVSDGIHTNDAVVIDGGTLSINATKDAIECEEGYILIQDGDITIVSGDEGITTSYEGTDSSIDPYMEINGGTLNITTTGTSAKGFKSLGDLTINGGNIRVKTSRQEAEGIESKAELVINDGYIIVEAYDDCINAATSLIINGGEIYCYSTANDAIDSNGTLTVTGGTVVAIGTSSPEDGFDCNQNTFTITGGTLIGVGGGTSIPTANTCKQPSLVYGGSVTQNTMFHISATDGTDVLTFKIPRTLQQMTLLFSSPALASDSDYTIYTGGSVTGGSDFYGLYTGATYSGGTQAATFTTGSMVTTVGSYSSGPGGNPGGFPGGNRPR